MDNKEHRNFFDYILNFSSDIYKWSEKKIDSIDRSKSLVSVLWFITILICFSAILFLNVLTPLISDDFAYLFIYGEDARISSIGDIVQSQINHYHMWGGRSVVHFIAQLLLMLPTFVTDLLNSLVYMVYIILIYLHIKGRSKGSISLFILINLAVWFLQPVFGDTILWITGASNYLWGTFFILLFLLPYRLYIGKIKGNNDLKMIVISSGMLLLGVLAGWTNENTAGAMILIALLFCYYFRIYKWKIPLWAISGLAGAIAGFAIMILAPGNFERAGEAGSLNLYLIGYRLFNCTLTFFYYCGPAILAYFAVWFIYRENKMRNNAKNKYMVLIYLLAAVGAVYAMLLSPTFPRRALFGVVTFLIIGMGILYQNINFLNINLRQFKFTVIAVGLIGFMFTFYLASKDINIYRNIVVDRETKIKQAMENGETSCQFERYDSSTYIHGEDPYSEELMSKYYGIKIKLVASDN